jgi:hypothetical protein
MNNPVQMHEVARCAPIATQRATFDDSSAITNATPNATSSLKALAGVVLARNTERNANAIPPEKQRNFCNKKSDEKLRLVAPKLQIEIDDLYHCRECKNYRNGYCTVQRIRPVDDIPRRCEDFDGALPLSDRGAEGKTSETAHNAEGRFFKWLIILSDGREFMAAAMPRQSLVETRELFPDAIAIEPVTGEDYKDE